MREAAYRLLLVVQGEKVVIPYTEDPASFVVNGNASRSGKSGDG